MYEFIARGTQWDHVTPITVELEAEFKFWSTNIHKLNRKHLYELSPPAHLQFTVKSDASNVACDAHLTLDLKLHIAHRNLSPEEKERSSTWRELDAVIHAIDSFIPLLRGKSVTREIRYMGNRQPSSANYQSERQPRKGFTKVGNQAVLYLRSQWDRPGGELDTESTKR